MPKTPARSVTLAAAERRGELAGQRIIGRFPDNAGHDGQQNVPPSLIENACQVRNATPGGGFDGSLLADKPRAQETMHQAGLYGLVALLLVNVFCRENCVIYRP
jgi:hypothetical protein